MLINKAVCQGEKSLGSRFFIIVDSLLIDNIWEMKYNIANSALMIAVKIQIVKKT